MIPLYPLRFEPILQPRIWGGRNLARWFGRATDEAIGEAWVLSDREDHPSRIADGPLQGRTLRQLMEEAAPAVLGRQAERHRRFPLLLKFLDARDTLSVQVHPTDSHTQLLPVGERGKTEAWVVLQAAPGSCIYAGLRPGTTPESFRAALAHGQAAQLLASFTPQPGDGVFLEAGTVHALGGGVLLFEVQQNSDVTFRLHDWDRIDAGTGKPRALHVEQGLACTDFARGPVGPVTPIEELLASTDALLASSHLRRERLFDCDHFRLWRLRGRDAFPFGALGECRALVALAGQGQLEYHATVCPIRQGDTFLWPAALNRGICWPAAGEELTLLEIALPE